MDTTPIKIVIAEDDPLLMRAYHDALVAKGYAVVIFFNADDAYKAIVEMPQKPAVILSDVMMPKMNGLQFLEKVRQSPELKSIPFVVMTSLTQKEHAEKALSLGANAYLLKGEDTLKVLVAKVEEIIRPQAS